MTPVASTRNILTPIGHEMSRLASQRESDSVLKNWQRSNRSSQQFNSSAAQVRNLARQFEKLRRRVLGGGLQTIAWHFGNKIEVDPSQEYSEQTIIHIQPTNDLVITGIHDRANPSGSMKQSCPGLWVSMQYVPAQVTISGVLQWNLPQWPLPVPTNYDDAANYWLYLGDIADC